MAARAPRLALLGGAWLAGSLLPVHNMLWPGPHLLIARYLYVSTVAFTLILAGLLDGLLAAPHRSARSAGALAALALLAGALGLSLANRDPWLASASVPAGLAEDLRSLDRAGQVAQVTFLGFPDVWEGAYLFNLELLPASRRGASRDPQRGSSSGPIPAGGWSTSGWAATGFGGGSSRAAPGARVDPVIANGYHLQRRPETGAAQSLPTLDERSP